MSLTALSTLGLGAAAPPVTTAAPSVNVAAPRDSGSLTATEATPTVLVGACPEVPGTRPTEAVPSAAADIGTALAGPRIAMDDGATASPDARGNYLFSPGTGDFDQAHSFASCDKTLRMFEHALG